ncbi:MAG: hypothetical protein ACRBFS_23810 [Aureispira sp.]
MLVSTPKKQRWFYLLVLGVFFCLPAFFNGFPFLFPDTGSYIALGFSGVLDDARTWSYSGFIRHISLAEIPWLVVLVQGLLLATTIYLMFRAFYSKDKSDKLFVVYSFLVGSTTAVSFHVSHLMPDIFTSIAVMSYCLLLIGHGLNRLEKGLALLLFMSALAMHNMHLLIVLGLTILIFLGSFWKDLKPAYQQLKISYKRLGAIMLCLISTYLLICSLHYTRYNGLFTATRGSSIFLFARLCDFGIAQAYLKENCEDGADGICSAKAKLTTSGHFLWSPTSYLNQNRGFHQDNQRYYSTYNQEILTTPKYLKQYLIRSIEAMFMQLVEIDYTPVENGGAWALPVIENIYPFYASSARSSKQMRNAYDPVRINFNNLIQRGVMITSLLLLLFLFWSPNYSIEEKAVAILIVLSLFINAFIAGAASGVYARYQNRIAWLLTLPAFWFCCSHVTNFYYSKNIIQLPKK